MFKNGGQSLFSRSFLTNTLGWKVWISFCIDCIFKIKEKLTDETWDGRNWYRLLSSSKIFSYFKLIFHSLRPFSLPRKHNQFCSKTSEQYSSLPTTISLPQYRTIYIREIRILERKTGRSSKFVHHFNSKRVFSKIALIQSGEFCF